ncbi:hypothetical protein K3495_g8243 [Podosphaera aphanis]|nr:hypothetical protein K3495_g8243 [Podosphaera aphanis]
MMRTYNQKQSPPVSSPVFNETKVYKALHTSPQWAPCGEDHSSKSVHTEPSRYVDNDTQWSRKPKLANNNSLAVSSHLSKELKSCTSVSPSRTSSGAHDAHDASVNHPSAIFANPKRKSSQVLADSPAAKYSNINLKRARPKQVLIKKLSPRYELCSVEDMVFLISDMIQELIQTNDNLPLQSEVLTRFHSRTPPAISVLNYLQRLAKHATLTPPLLLSMVYYIDKLCSLYPAFTVNSLTVHRFLITAGTVAAKGLSDSFWSNATYARVGGIKCTELGLLELDFLYRLDWRIVPRSDALLSYYNGLIARTSFYKLGNENPLGNDNDFDEDNDAFDDDDDDFDDDDDDDENEGDEKILANERTNLEAQTSNLARNFSP